MATPVELILICLVAVALLALVARKIGVPYPILLTIAGGLLAFVPGLPQIRLDPKLVFDLFLPPLIYPAAVYTSWRDFRANLRSILPLAIFLVLLTMTVTGYLFHALTGLPLAVGFVFGALISPPDAVAALAVTQNLRVPRKIIVILEGESLVNDATSFISFRFAVAAVLTGSFSLGEASVQFLLVAAGGVAVGLATGWLATRVQKRLDDPPVPNDVLTSDAVRCLLLRRDAPRLRYPGRGHRRHLLRVARAPGLERADASSGYPGLANGNVHPQRHSVHADRTATATGHSRTRAGHDDRSRQAGFACPSRPGARSFRLVVRRYLSAASIQQNVSPKKPRTLAADSLDCLDRNARRRFVSRRSRNPLSSA